MIMNLKTTLNAYPKLSPSVLKDYVTKTELEEKNYVDHDALTTILEDFVRDVETEGTNIIYGRVKGKWVPVVDIPEQTAGIMCWGMINSSTLSAEQMMHELDRQNFLAGVNEYSVECTPTENGYFWFTSTTPIDHIIADNGLSYKQAVAEAPTISISYKGKNLNFYCYRTQKLVALPGITYKFRVNV